MYKNKTNFALLSKLYYFNYLPLRLYKTTTNSSIGLIYALKKFLINI